MLEEKFCVVANNSADGRKSFSHWHSSYDMAKAEAERLCNKEGIEFYVLKVIAICKIAKAPVVWEE